MRCEVVAVGTELLLGQIVDTNAAYLAGRLAALGVDCHHITTVG
ncbi:MAG: competence/damage-inducible protein A, partial [Actinobacteria bacterium]|nr:competence/damage-inducible protein A [Actinomycetota bacterium]